MHFAKDILLIDFEATTGKPDLAEPTQLAGVLLDKDTLEEKDSFVSYIAANLRGVDPKIMAISGITESDLKGAPSAIEVAKIFLDKFGDDVLLASWVEYLDRRLLIKMFKKAGLEYKYDHHYIDLWPLAYVELVKQNYQGGLNSEAVFQAYGLPKRNHHDALQDCRLEAEVLRKIMQK